ncbi:SDR family NAD(P)-dependent oxidoreductase [Parvibaculum sp.]|jgi:NAD(P)-dependent dehydrogenase (short-subunit alcohol dehydrogenase family)|uniref:SDR family NAD(P)-dependent oxidoreductase n=1 Tax=Parvibaculum sp. TaxID=2024848 RepID=UPI001B1F8F3C|nr:SDR family NAD(P)-dependent oxidoreductase [Parvibaculum sp.]MBO6635791.1 SDR family NAD(P)-dependent oxidoreductase [Parvibaculum sp.]MBO6678051.1 SDR family NAD(P)-dependent oxidoreductase [Parvibaculum sp.]MBO6684373.1 SDR family NAD(P)-dependent oxidoreductase [Parvibaculum sp.]MBO6906570.1 SDR family NAD(P)-dependent oxidoreductase [Parvibaculum sp.]
MTEIKGKLAIVTGAASGIGRGTALELARRGARLAISDLDRAGLAETAKRIEAIGAPVTTYLLDVADRDAVYAFAQEIETTHGGADIVVNNAGVAQIARVDELTYEDFEWVMNIDFWGMVYGTKAFLPQMQAKGAGHIVNVSSVFGIISVPTQAAYNSAKFAIRGFTEALRHEMKGTQIKVSCVHPGGIKTNIVRNARFLQSTQATAREDAASGFDKLAMTTPEKAGRVIVNGIAKNKPRILIGIDAKIIDWMQRLMPVSYGRIMFRGEGSPLTGQADTGETAQ